MKEDSLQEIIAKELAPYFGIDPIEQSDKITFMSSGREDIDVRCLGKGRPFVMEFTDSRIATLPKEVAADMECRVDSSQQVSIQHLQLVKRYFHQFHESEIDFNESIIFYVSLERIWRT